MGETVALIGMLGGEFFGSGAARALDEADIVAGAPRHLGALAPEIEAERVELAEPVDTFLERVADWHRSGKRVALLASGDPGFFGLARIARARLGEAEVAVHPAPSSVAMAFGRAAVPWDDAVVVSAHGRPIEPAIDAIIRNPKVAVLTSPDNRPEHLGRLLAGQAVRDVVVASRIGQPDESLWRGDVDALAAGEFDALSVVIFISPAPSEPALTWGLPDTSFAHREGMITKSEVRAIALGKLGIPAAGILWDVGAGSGSVSAECARLAPGLRVFAVERRADDAARMRSNLKDVEVTVVEGEAPDVLEGLPDPDRVFVGGGGLAVLDAAIARLRREGRIVATYAALDRAAACAERLGHMVQVSISRGSVLEASGSWRLAAENPVFVCWGPDE